MNDNYHTHNISIVFISKSCFIPIQPHENKDLRTARIFTQKLPFQRSRETDDRYQPADCVGNFKWAEHMALVNLPLEPPIVTKKKNLKK